MFENGMCVFPEDQQEEEEETAARVFSDESGLGPPKRIEIVSNAYDINYLILLVWEGSIFLDCCWIAIGLLSEPPAGPRGPLPW